MNRAVNRRWNSVQAWSGLAWKMAEMSIAPAAVVGPRTDRIVKTGAILDVRDRSEFARMSDEKVEAGIESAAVLGRRGTAVQINHSARTFGLMLESATAFMSLYGSQNSRQFSARQGKLTRTPTQLTGSAIDLSNSTARLATLDSCRSIRAVANAERLGKW